MTLYEMIEKYGKGKGEAVMWESTKAISDFVAPMEHTHKQEYWSLMRKVFGIMSGGHYNEEFAKSYRHEIGHLATHIASAFKLNLKGEVVQYIGDAILGKTWDIAKKQICEC